MADFAAILKKTLDKMGETTPEMRAKVYDKARETVQRQIDALATRPSQAAVDRQFAKLDEAIAVIEADFAPPIEPEISAEPEIAAEAEPVEVVAETEAVDAPTEVDQPEAAAKTEASETAEPEQPEPEAEQPQAEIEAEQVEAREETEPAEEPADADEAEVAETEIEVEAAAAEVEEEAAAAEVEEETPPAEAAAEEGVVDPDVVAAPAADTDDAGEADVPEVDAAEDEQHVPEEAADNAQPVMQAEPVNLPLDDEEHVAPPIGAEADEAEEAAEPTEEQAQVAAEEEPEVDEAPQDESDAVEIEAADDAGDDAATSEPPPDDPADPTVDEVLASFDDAAEEREPETETNLAELAPANPLLEVEPVMPRAEADDPLLDFLNKQHDELLEKEVGDGDADRAADMLFGEAGETTDDGSGADTPHGEARSVSAAEAERASGFRWGRWAIFAIILALLGGGAYGAYTNQEPIRALLAEYGVELPALGGEEPEAVTDADGVPVRTVDTVSVNGDDAAGEADGETAAEADTELAPTETVNAAGTEEAVQKFTQRLTADGREVDDGPADGTAGTGEGSTVSGQTVEGDVPPATADTDGATEDTAETAEQGVAVGQRTIFYEERTGTQPGTAIQGSTVWSIARESPGGELPVEPVIRAESAVPDLGLTLEMTIRRNGDATFPASHIVELFFAVPDTFEGRGIADVQRITFKNTEQDPGSALIAVPAPIDTNIFLVALTDADTAVQTNMSLMLSQGWVDIPMQYVSGRRALITLEKGAAGDRIFREVFDAWEEVPLAGAGGG